MQLDRSQLRFANCSKAPVESGWTLVNTVTCYTSWMLTSFWFG